MKKVQDIKVQITVHDPDGIDVDEFIDNLRGKLTKAEIGFQDIKVLEVYNYVE